MSDERRASAPNPHLRTRPATMITAIGLCIVVMLMQLVPEFRDAGSRLSAPSPAATR